MVKPDCSLPWTVELDGAKESPELFWFFRKYGHRIVNIIDIEVTLFEKLVELSQFPLLRILTLVNTTDDLALRLIHTSNFFQTRGDRLIDLRLLGNMYAKVGYMKSLKQLYWNGSVIVSSDEPLSKMLQSLTHLDIPYQDLDTTPLFNFTSNDSVFEFVVSFEIREEYDLPTADSEKNVATRIAKCFPNLSNLRWKSECNLSQRIADFQTIFSTLKHLKCLELCVEEAEAAELFQLLTGLETNEIPPKELIWFGLLQGKQNALCNLQSKSNILCKKYYAFLNDKNYL